MKYTSLHQTIQPWRQPWVLPQYPSFIIFDFRNWERGFIINVERACVLSNLDWNTTYSIRFVWVCKDEFTANKHTTTSIIKALGHLGSPLD